MPGIAISHEVLDANPYLLNCANGTLDLRSGHLRPHSRADLLTKTTGVEVLVGDERPYCEICPAWIGFLGSVFCGDQGLIDFVQRLCGQSLIGEVQEHILPIFWGSGANGKSTFINVISHAIGDYFYAAPHRFLLQKRNEGHPTELAALHGKRFVSISETGDGAKLDEALVKSLTGGDMITARGMNENFWSFTPSHTVIMSTNHKPVVRGTDHGMWRRLRLVPFVPRFVDESELAANPGCLAKDPTISDRLRAEAPGILLWLVDGAILYQRDGGLREPEIVRAATDEYRVDSDLIGQWLGERCVLHPTARERTDDLYHSYRTWAEQGGLHPVSQTAWGRSLTERRYKARKSGAWYRCGLRLQQNL
jgi:putative DNA primase/helicase